MTSDTEALPPCPFCGRYLQPLNALEWQHPGEDCDGSCILAGYVTKAPIAWSRRATPASDVDTIGSHIGNGGSFDPVAGEASFKRGDPVEKISGSKWRGVVVGEYSTALTPEGYAVESATETGSVQIYPAKALRLAALKGPAA